MIKEYYLIKISSKQIKVIDKTLALNLKDAEKKFKSRNLFYKILKKNSLKILEERKIFE